jgi:hypothetical protein
LLSALALSIGTLQVGVAPNLAPTVYGEDLEEHTERLTMIVDTLEYFFEDVDTLIGACPFATAVTAPVSGNLAGFWLQVREVKGGPGDCWTLQAFEVRASADVAALKADGAKSLKAARLSYDETPRTRGNPWTGSDTCVGQVVGLFGVDDEDGQPRPRTYDSGASRSGATEWNVTGLVSSWFTGAAENNGLLLLGQLEPGQYGDDSKACLSVVTNLRLDVTVMRESQVMESDVLPSDLIRANTPTPTRTPGPIERDKQNVDTDLLVYKTPTPTHTLPGDIDAQPRSSEVVSKPSGSDLVRAVTSTPTRTPEPIVVPKPRGPFTQP